jgi:prevent-host-death family protein
MNTINASDFKAKCLSLLDEVARTGRTLTILKRGKPVAQLVPAVPVEKGFAQTALKGTVRILGDVVSPVLPAGTWEAERSE